MYKDYKKEDKHLKKQWIRIISFIMMICMISMVSIGCGRSNQDSGKKLTINILNYKRETVDILQKMIDKFEKENPNIHIQMDSPSDAMTILKTRLVKENPPDIAILGGERSYADFVDADTIVDISDYKGLDKVKDVYKDMAKQLELSKKKGTYCVPYAANAAGVLYNRDMFKKYGWKIPETWDEFISLCKQIKSDGETPFYFMLKDSWTGITPWNALAANLTSTTIYDNVNQGKDSFSNHYGEPAKKLKELLNYGQKDPFAYSYNDGTNAFSKGDSAMLLTGNFAIPQIRSTNPDMNLGAFTLPVLNDASKTKLVSGIDVMFSVMKADHKKECLKFIDFMLQDENVVTYMKQSSSVSCIEGKFPIPDDLKEMEKYFNNNRVIDFPDHHYPADLPAGDMIQGYLMNNDMKTFLNKFDTEWKKSNRNLIRKLQK